MTARRPGGVIHTYLGYDPQKFPSPTAPPADVVSGAFEHLLMYGSTRRLTDEELANAVRLDPSQIQGLGPSLDAIIAMLEERRRKLLATYETKTVQKRARREYERKQGLANPSPELKPRFLEEAKAEHLRGLERLWYRAERDDPPFAMDLVGLMERLAEKYEVDALAAKWTFTGRTPLSIEDAIKLKEELETIERLLEQLREARKNAQVAIIDMEALSEFTDPSDIDGLRELQERVREMIETLAREQGIEKTADGYRLTPKSMRIFQGRLLEAIFSDLEAARRGRHTGPIDGDGAVEMPTTRPYEFGDSVAHMDMTQSLVNAMIRHAGEGGSGPLRLHGDDIEIHRTRNTPKCATAVIMDMSGSMRWNGLYVQCKRMGLALDGLIRREYPGDFLRFIEMYSFGKLRTISEIPELMPKPVTIREPVVRLRADMSDPNISELDIPPHFTNIQHALLLARRQLSVQDTPNKQIMLITDGLPTAHFEGEQLFLLYPPDRRTEEATMRKAQACAQEGITINIFLLQTWSQSEEDVKFAQRLVERTKGRVFFTGGGDLDRFVVWDYVSRRRRIIG